jgi:hypothetical protein
MILINDFKIFSLIQSFQSKSKLQRYLTHFIIPHACRIKSIQLSNPFAADMFLLLSPVMKDLTQLEALNTLNNIESDYIEEVVFLFTCFIVINNYVP